MGVFGGELEFGSAWQRRCVMSKIFRIFGFQAAPVSWLLGFNKNMVKSIFQITGWQVRKRTMGSIPPDEAEANFYVALENVDKAA